MKFKEYDKLKALVEKDGYLPATIGNSVIFILILIIVKSSSGTMMKIM